MWPLWASLHPPPPPPPPTLPHPAPIIISSLLSAWSPPHQAPPPNPRAPAACTPSFTTSTASPPLPLPPPPPRLLRPCPPGRTNRRKPLWIRKCPSLPAQGWPAVMTSRRWTVAMAVTRVSAATQAARKAGVHV